VAVLPIRNLQYPWIRWKRRYSGWRRVTGGRITRVTRPWVGTSWSVRTRCGSPSSTVY